MANASSNVILSIHNLMSSINNRIILQNIQLDRSLSWRSLLSVWIKWCWEECASQLSFGTKKKVQLIGAILIDPRCYWFVKTALV